jgi:hypothetical protein
MSLRVPTSLTAILVLLGVTSAHIAAGATQERRSDPIGDLTGRDAVGFRKDKVTKESVGERTASPPPSTKQAMEDFREIQELNFALRRLAKEKPLAFQNVAETARKMRVVSSRLNFSLVLPKPRQKLDLALAETPEALQNQIADIDSSVKAFVTNPMFQQLNDSTRDLPREAGENLNKVVALSKLLEEGATKLGGTD